MLSDKKLQNITLREFHRMAQLLGMVLELKIHLPGAPLEQVMRSQDDLSKPEEPIQTQEQTSDSAEGDGND